MASYLTHSAADTRAFGGALALALRPGDALLLHGDLGAGKSELARGVAFGLGVSGPMPSPTFTLMQPHQGRDMMVYHFDLYRLSDMDEFFAAGLDEFLDAGGVALIEWPLPGMRPLSCIEIHIERAGDEDGRRIGLDCTRFARAAQVTDAVRNWEAEV